MSTSSGAFAECIVLAILKLLCSPGRPRASRRQRVVLAMAAELRFRHRPKIACSDTITSHMPSSAEQQGTTTSLDIYQATATAAADVLACHSELALDDCVDVCAFETSAVVVEVTVRPMGRKPSNVYDYFTRLEPLDGKGLVRYECKKCQKQYASNATRLAEHLKQTGCSPTFQSNQRSSGVSASMAATAASLAVSGAAGAFGGASLHVLQGLKKADHHLLTGMLD
ncbi:hypothetical protein BBJ28_00025695, partial [Nothophytophthora sp. Chile5]